MTIEKIIDFIEKIRSIDPSFKIQGEGFDVLIEMLEAAQKEHDKQSNCCQKTP